MSPESPEMVAARQRNARIAHTHFQEQFADAEAMSEYMRGLGARSNERRLVLSADDTDALLEAYALLSSIAERARAKRAKLAANGHGDDDPEEPVTP